MTDEWTPEQYREHYSKVTAQKIKAQGRKFGNVITEIDGIKFDSTKEALYYGKLKLRVKAGNLLRFDHHVIYALIVNGHKVADYEADFVLYHPDGTKSVVDVKGKATEHHPVFRLKKALMWAIHKINVQTV